MKPIGPLMREHRLIERMVRLVADGMNRLSEPRSIADQLFFNAVVDFFRTYADRTHHGKEEDILFKALKNKRLSKEHRKTMEELITEHVIARSTVKALVEAEEAFIKGNLDARKEILKHIKELVALYPKHIEKEDKHFFYPILDYFTVQEQDDMLRAFWEFDRNMIHEKYGKIVDWLAGK